MFGNRFLFTVKRPSLSSSLLCLKYYIEVKQFHALFAKLELALEKELPYASKISCVSKQNELSLWRKKTVQ